MTDFLLVNGYAMPVRYGTFKRSQNVAPALQRAIDESLHSHANGRKIAIQGGVPIREPATAEAIAGLLSGRGHVFHFGADTATSSSRTVDLCSARGLYPSGTPIGYLAKSAAFNNGLSATDSYSTSSNVTMEKLGGGCLQTGPAATNLLTPNCADGTDTSSATTGFTARVGAGTSVLSSSTAAYFRNSRSLLATVSAHVAVGWECEYASGVASTMYAGAVFLLAVSGTPQVDVWIRDNTAGTDGTKVRVTLSPTVWRRVEAAHTTSGAGGAHVVKLIVETAGTTGDDFYADELLLCATSTPNAGAWVAGGATRTATNLLYPLLDFRATDDFTIMAWVRTNLLSSGVGGLGQVLFQIGDSTTNCVSIAGQLGDDGVTTLVNGVAGAHEDLGSYLSDANAEWTHVAVVVRRLDGSITTYGDGVVSGAAATGSLPSFSEPILAIGSDIAGAHIFEGLIDEVVFVPWAMSTAQIAAWYAREFSDLPRLDVSGSHLAGTSVEMEMLSDQNELADSYVSGSTDGVFSERHRELGFKLVEV